VADETLLAGGTTASTCDDHEPSHGRGGRVDGWGVVSKSRGVPLVLRPNDVARFRSRVLVTATCSIDSLGYEDRVVLPGLDLALAGRIAIPDLVRTGMLAPRRSLGKAVPRVHHEP
jgi:hypothetical protein